MSARLLLAAGILTLTACATISARDADIFERPELNLEQEVTLCGYIRSAFEDNNIWIDRNAWVLRADGDPHVGLGLRPDPYDLLARKHDRRGCVRGEVIRTGCGEEAICTDSSFPYAIRLTR